MDVTLPDSGCNIIQSDNLVYNYSTDLHTRKEYVIYDGVAKLRNESYSQYGYSYSGECLNTGDLVYKPEIKSFWMPHVAIGAFIFICLVVFRLLRGNR